MTYTQIAHAKSYDTLAEWLRRQTWIIFDLTSVSFVSVGSNPTGVAINSFIFLLFETLLHTTIKVAHVCSDGWREECAGQHFWWQSEPHTPQISFRVHTNTRIRINPHFYVTLIQELWIDHSTSEDKFCIRLLAIHHFLVVWHAIWSVGRGGCKFCLYGSTRHCSIRLQLGLSHA